MITTAVTLEKARVRWLLLGRSSEPFRLAVTVLDSAACQADVDLAFAVPNFLVKRLSFARDLYEILTDGDVIVTYRLTELNPGPGADVEILP